MQSLVWSIRMIHVKKSMRQKRKPKKKSSWQKSHIMNINWMLNHNISSDEK